MTKLLIVEDDPTLQNAYKTTLTMEGYDAAVASDGEEGLTMAQANAPDVILLDMLMPKVSGLEFLRRYGEGNASNLAKVIVFSNVNSPDDVDEALALGATKYITKSNFTPKEIVAVVQEVLTAPPDSPRP